MHRVSLAVLPVILLTAAVPFATSSVPRLQIQLPRKTSPLLQEDFLTDQDVTEEVGDGSSESVRLREALRALLALNDGELRALMSGVPVSSVGGQLTPSTEFLLKASKKYLGQLKDSLQNQETRNLLVDEDMKIARRKKLFQRLLQSETQLEDSIELEMKNYDRDSDSLIGALADLSTYLDKKDYEDTEMSDDKPRNRRSQGKHKRRNRFHSRKSKTIHYSYWLRSDECPSQDGIQKLFCPSPTPKGEWICINDVDICDGHSHCPDHDDEDPKACLYFKALRNHINLLERSIILSRRS